MKKVKPIIKLNGGNPIALCNRCFAIICYVKCGDSENIDDCIVFGQYRDEITESIGDKVPTHCSKCKELLKYSLNE